MTNRTVLSNTLRKIHHIELGITLGNKVGIIFPDIIETRLCVA